MYDHENVYVVHTYNFTWMSWFALQHREIFNYESIHLTKIKNQTKNMKNKLYEPKAKTHRKKKFAVHLISQKSLDICISHKWHK